MIWPPSEITLPSAKLGLTEEAWKIAYWMSKEVGHLTSEQSVALVGVLRDFSQSNLSPRTRVPEAMLDTVRYAIEGKGPAHVAQVLLSVVDRCKTRHDLRGWAWQCTWALGNRAELLDAKK